MEEEGWFENVFGPPGRRVTVSVPVTWRKWTCERCDVSWRGGLEARICWICAEVTEVFTPSVAEREAAFMGALKETLKLEGQD